MSETSPGLVPVAEIRDYRRINAEVLRLLDAGCSRVVLSGVEGQRLLLYGLRGVWNATVVVQGPAGPELAAELDAPGVCIWARGAADGAGRALRAGRLLIQGDAGDALAYELSGGFVGVIGAAGQRAGLRMAGGTLLLCGPVGRLLGDRQSGGLILAAGGLGTAHAGHGHTGGRLRFLDPAHTLEPEDEQQLRAALAGFSANGKTFLPAHLLRFAP